MMEEERDYDRLGFPLDRMRDYERDASGVLTPRDRRTQEYELRWNKFTGRRRLATFVYLAHGIKEEKRENRGPAILPLNAFRESKILRDSNVILNRDLGVNGRDMSAIYREQLFLPNESYLKSSPRPPSLKSPINLDWFLRQVY